MSTGEISEAQRVSTLLARGEIALILLDQIAAHVAEFDASKKEVDQIYAERINDCNNSLAIRIAAAVRRANAALESITIPDDEIDKNGD